MKPKRQIGYWFRLDEMGCNALVEGLSGARLWSGPVRRKFFSVRVRQFKSAILAFTASVQDWSPVKVAT